MFFIFCSDFIDTNLFLIFYLNNCLLKNKTITIKSKLAKKKGFTYEELCVNTENILKELPQKTYQNLIWGRYFKPYKRSKVYHTK